MVSALRRLLWLGLIGGVGYTAWAVWRHRQGQGGPAATPAAPPEWPPLRTWSEPVDGACPEGYPVKANGNSGIYHVPGGRSYDRTVPDRCYADPAAAEADGYRAAKA
jgi:hypothetical protein